MIHVWQAVNVPILSMTLFVRVCLDELAKFVRYVTPVMCIIAGFPRLLPCTIHVPIHCTNTILFTTTIVN